MAERRLEIEIEVEATGGQEANRAKGWIEELRQEGEKASRQNDELRQSYNRLTGELEETGQAISRINRRFKDGQGEVRQMAEELYDINVNLRRGIDPLEDYQHHIDRVNDELRRWTTDTREHSRIEEMAGSTRFKQLESMARMLSVMNRLRFHTTELADATGILNRETFESSRQTNLAKDDFDSLERTLQTLTTSVRNLTENLEKQEKRTTAVDFATDALGTEIQSAGDRAYYLNEALFEGQQQLEIWKTRAEIARLQAEALGHEFNRTEQETEELTTEMQQLQQEVDQVGDEMKQTGNRANDMADDLGKSHARAEAFGEFMGNIFAELIEEAAQAVLEFTRDSVQAFFDFDRQSREIFTLMPQASGVMREQLANDARNIGAELGRLPEEVLPAIYNALSAGIPPENVLDDIRTASDAARAGVADLGDTMALGVGILNAQVSGVEDLGDVYDQLFFLVQKGVTTIPQLNGELAKVTSVAGEAGVSMQDIVAAMIVMTRQGDTTAEATELLSIMLTQLATSGTTLATVFEEAAGRSFRQFVAEGGSLADAMQILQQHAANTGQALGDILGGGSPFFRDTQAARGVLELTGKHLQDLTLFSQQAETATGAMAQAALIMGENGELGALRYQAAMADLKITVGEYLAEQATPLLENATAFLKVWSGNEQRAAHSAIQEIITETGSLEEATRRLNKLYAEMNTPLGQVTGGLNTIKEEMIQVAAQAGDFKGTNDDIVETLSNLYDGTFQVGNGIVYMNGSMFTTVERLQELSYEYSVQNALLAANSDEVALSDAKLLQYNNTIEIGTETLQTYTVAAGELINVYDNLSTAEDRLTFAAALARDTHEEASLAYEVTAEQVEAVRVAHEEATAAVEQNTTAYANYVLQSIDANTTTTNWKDELFRAGLQAGITQEQIILLATATGEYSQEQIEAMLKTAAMKAAVEQLGQAMANGELTTKQALQALEDLETQLDQDYTAQLKYDDITKAKEEAFSLKDQLDKMQGVYTAEVNVHTTYTSSGTPSGHGPGGPIANYAGGPFRAGDLMLVGDGPGGQILPTTELVVFDRPGTVVPGDVTKQLLEALNKGGGRGNQYIIHTQDNTAALLAQLQAREQNKLITKGM
ncbi:MAG: phage tail tape measure protein [Anaerolineae bacterium]|nr:phage tail tape measure protein [Anaerolineae bacterium]